VEIEVGIETGTMDVAVVAPDRVPDRAPGVVHALALTPDLDPVLPLDGGIEEVCGTKAQTQTHHPQQQDQALLLRALDLSCLPAVDKMVEDSVVVEVEVV